MKPSLRPVVRRASQRGVVLIAALAVLLMLTLLSVGLFRGFGLEERITGNSREKAHAFYAAQTALQYAEQQIVANPSTVPTSCTTATITADSIQLCSNTTSYETTPSVFTGSSSTTPWSSLLGVANYTLPSGLPFTTTAPGSSATAATVSAYLVQAPQYQVTYVGSDPSRQGASLYLVTSLGYGANTNAATVVQSTYSVGPSVQSAGQN